MGTKLAHQLLDRGFFSALGTTELSHGMKSMDVVKRAKPLTIDANNGVIVIYDDEGRPWVKHIHDFERLGIDTTGGALDSLADLVSEFKLTRGAYVPHSNDGGQFLLLDVNGISLAG